jgi:hypothetical protein
MSEQRATLLKKARERLVEDRRAFARSSRRHLSVKREASVAIALVLLKPGNFCRALAVKLA